MCIRTCTAQVQTLITSLTTLKFYFQFYKLKNQKLKDFSSNSANSRRKTLIVTKRRENLPKPGQQQRSALQREKRLSLGGFWNWRIIQTKPPEKSKTCLSEHWKNQNHNGLVVLLSLGVSFNVWTLLLISATCSWLRCRQCVKGPFCLYCFVVLHTSVLCGISDSWKFLYLPVKAKHTVTFHFSISF